MRAAILFAAAALAAPAAAPAADWTTFGFESGRSGSNTGEAHISPANAGGLKKLWAHDLGGVVNAQPLYAGGVVFAGAESGRLAAIDAKSGAALWTRRLSTKKTACRDVPGGIHGVSATPVLDRGSNTIWVSGGDTRLWALDMTTGRTRKGWPVRVGSKAGTEHIWGALLLSRGRLYAATASHCDNAFYRARLAAFHPKSGKRLGEWRPVERGNGGGIWGWGGVVADPSGDLYVATANAQYPLPENSGNAEHVVRLSSRLKVEQSNYPGLPKMADNDFGGSPILFQGSGCPPQLAVVHKNGQLLVYDRRSLHKGPTQRLQIGSLKAFTALGSHAWSSAQRTLYVANGSSSRRYKQGLVTLRLNAACKLELAWQQAIGTQGTYPATPAIVNGVVFFGDGSGRRLHAFDAKDGRSLWSGLVGGDLYAGPSVGDGRVFVPAWDGKVHAYGL